MINNKDRIVNPIHVAKNPGSIPFPIVLMATKHDKINVMPAIVSTLFALLLRFENRAIEANINVIKLIEAKTTHINTVPNPSSPSS